MLCLSGELVVNYWQVCVSRYMNKVKGSDVIAYQTSEYTNDVLL